MPDEIKSMNLFLQLRCESFQGKKKKWNIHTIFYDFYFIRHILETVLFHSAKIIKIQVKIILLNEWN